jgi:hypothetical protein
MLSAGTVLVVMLARGGLRMTNLLRGQRNFAVTRASAKVGIVPKQLTALLDLRLNAATARDSCAGENFVHTTTAERWPESHRQTEIHQHET